MAGNGRYSLFPCSFVHGGGTMNLAQLGRATPSPQAQQTDIIPAGAVDRAAVLLPSANPRVTLQTRDLATLLATVSLSTGLVCTGATFRYQQREESGTFATGSVHDTVAAAGGGFLHITSISVSQGQEATVELEFIPFWNGTNNPLVHAASVSFAAAPSPAFVSAFYMAPVLDDDTAFAHITQWSFSPGINFSPTMTSGTPFPVGGAIVSRSPTLRFTANKVSDIAARNLFTSAFAGTVNLTLRKGINDGVRVADTEEEHIIIAATDGNWSLENIEGGDNGDVSVSYMGKPTVEVSVDASGALAEA